MCTRVHACMCVHACARVCVHWPTVCIGRLLRLWPRGPVRLNIQIYMNIKAANKITTVSAQTMKSRDNRVIEVSGLIFLFTFSRLVAYLLSTYLLGGVLARPLSSELHCRTNDAKTTRGSNCSDAIFEIPQ